MLIDPQYDGHIMMWDDGPGAVTVSSYIHGWEETAITAEQLAESKAEWTCTISANDDLGSLSRADRRLRKRRRLGGYAAGRLRDALAGGKVPVAYADPKEGRNSWVGVYGIRSDSPNYELALRFLDEKLGDPTART